jgi:hypothetical protein
MRSKLMLLCALLFVFAAAGSAGAAIVTTVGSYYTEAAAIQALDNWRGASPYNLLETFEGFNPEVPMDGAALGHTPTNGQPSYTSFGGTMFYVDGGLPGAGAMRFADPSNFGVLDRDVAQWDNRGRTRGWADNSWFGEQYLDSGDVSKISLNHSLAQLELTSLFFFMFDVSDQFGAMTVTMNDGSIYTVDGLANPQANGLITFMGIQTDADDFISKITWEMSTDNDGFGLDNFGTLNPVPLPASLLLLGSGLLGLGAVRRKKKK